MDGEFNTACATYYHLNQVLAAKEVRFQKLVSKALPYTGQTNLFELDRIISCNRKVQQAQADVEQTEMELSDLESIIFKMMEYFDIPPGTKLSGGIADELEFEIWADEQDVLYCEKTKDLNPPADNPNTITIKFYNSSDRPEVEVEEE